MCHRTSSNFGAGRLDAGPKLVKVMKSTAHSRLR